MEELVPPFGEPFLLPRLQLGGIDILDLELQHLPQTNALGHVAAESRNLVPYSLPFPVHPTVLLQLVAVLGVIVQQGAVSRRLHELLVVALPVDVDQQLPRLTEDALGHGTAVDAGGGTPIPRQDTLEQKVIPLGQVDAQLG